MIQNNKFSYCNILSLMIVMNLILYIQISMKASYKLMLWFLMGMVKHSKSHQNSWFAMSLQYLKKEVRDEVDFLHADKHQSLLQVNFNTLSIKVFYKVILSSLIGMIKHSQKAQSNKLAMNLQDLTKEVSQTIWINNW